MFERMNDRHHRPSFGRGGVNDTMTLVPIRNDLANWGGALTSPHHPPTAEERFARFVLFCFGGLPSFLALSFFILYGCNIEGPTNVGDVSVRLDFGWWPAVPTSTVEVSSTLAVDRHALATVVGWRGKGMTRWRPRHTESPRPHCILLLPLSWKPARSVPPP